MSDVRIVGTSRERIVGAATASAFASHGLVAVGITEASSHYAFHRLNPDRCQMLACVAGRGQVWVDGSWTESKPGTVYLTPQGVPHAYRAGGSRRWKIAWVSYARPIIRIKAPALLSIECDSLQAAIAGLHAESISGCDGLVMRCWTDLIHAQVCRLLAMTRDGSRLWPVWRACDSNLGHPWTLVSLARIAGMSPEHLRRLCLVECGMSPMRHLALLRLRAAATILVEESMTIEEVAPRLGYASSSALSAAFKRMSGLSPQSYRQDIREGRSPKGF